MGKDAPAAPAAPDPSATAAAQGQQNRETALANLETSMVGQQTPYGSLSYAQTGSTAAGNPQYTATTTLSPEQQQLLGIKTTGQINLGNLGLDQLGRIQTSVAQPFSYDNVPAAPTNDPAAIATLRNQIVSRNQPFMDQQLAALQTQLANQGITDQGSQAYQNAMLNYNQGVNNFNLGADQTAQNEYGQVFNQQMQARQQAIQEEAYARDRPLAEYTAFTSGNAPQMPQFANTPSLAQQPADITGPTYAGYQGQLQANQIGAQNAASSNAGLFGLGSAGIGAAALLAFSDERLKTNIEKVGERDDGIGVYTYDYKWGDGPYVGVMAQEVERVRPDAVVNIDGAKAVAYSKLLANGV